MARALVEFLELLSFFFQFFCNHGVVFDDLILEVLAVPQGLLNFFLQALLILYSFAAVGDKFLGQFFDLVDFLFELLDRLTFDFDHFLEVVAFEDKVGNRFLVVSLVSSTDLNKHVQSLMLQ